MNVFDKILSLTLIEELTESPWWTDSVFRALEQDASNENGYDTEIAGPAAQRVLQAAASRRKAS